MSVSILIAPTAFKGNLSAHVAALAMADGARAAAPDAEIRVQPLADGGNGLLDAIEALGGGNARVARVDGPLGGSVSARYLVQGERVVVETAEACGLHLVPPTLRDPTRTTTRGVGQLLLAARNDARTALDAVDPERGGAATNGGPEVVVGLGGSATVDAGAGMAAALGWRLLDDAGRPIPPGAAALLRLATIEPPETRPLFGRLVVLADVANPLLGDRGAARVFGPQKGASPDDVETLVRALERWADVVRRELGVDVATLEGGGAAGGLGAAFAALLEAPPRPGATWLLEAAGFDALLADADVLVTGEGAWDVQSTMGKVTGEVVARACGAGVPVLLVCGALHADTPAGAVAVEGGRTLLDAAALAELTAAGLVGLLPSAGGR